MATRQCPYCGKYVHESMTQCPFCREGLSAVPKFNSAGLETSKRYIRRGLVYMLMGAAIDYFLGGHSGLQFPFTVVPVVTDYLVPFLFLAGFGLVLFGIYRRYSG